MKLRVMTYNILQGGAGRESLIFEVISTQQPDVIILQELASPALLEDFAAKLGMHSFFAKANLQLLRYNDKIGFNRRNIGLLSRYPIVAAHSYHPFILRRTLLEATIEYAPDQQLNLFGVHLLAYLAFTSELWRVWEIATIIRRTRLKQVGKCLVIGDFNTIAKPDKALVEEFPPKLRTIIRLQGNKIYRLAIPKMVKAGFVDCYRALHQTENGFTLPPPKPNTRLDYIFANPTFAATLQYCEVVTEPLAVQYASDHYPVIADFEL